MPAEATPPAQLKELFDEPRYRGLAALIQGAVKKFDQKLFLTMTLEGLGERSLMQRLHQTSLALGRALPGPFRADVDHLRQLAPQVGHSFVAIALCDFVATYGQDDPDFALAALRDLTPYGSAEFAVRPFLQRDLHATLRVMRGWSADANEHVRRLASEGSRPRLPWGQRLQALVADPTPTAPILDALRDDPALYVRKSVANHLNDITKDHPDWVLDRLAAWQIAAAPNRQWIAKHACRTLIKRGHPRALQLFGFGRAPQLTAALHVSPPQLRLGQTLTLDAALTSTVAEPQRLVVDYIVHYIKAGGAAAEKTFKWIEVDLPAEATQRLTKSQTIRDFTTRKHHPGRHRVELQVNGHRLAEAAFELHL
jgi:3-methyladenine DNA glycosylase AlkC